MYEKHYVVQERFHSWETWMTLPGQYKTLDEARAAKEQKPKGPYYRVAESFVQIRYKAIKT